MIDSIKNRVGKFYINSNIITDSSNRNMLSLLFSKVIIVEATMKFANNSIDYTALSEHFSEIEDGTYPPYYKIIIEDNLKITFQKILDNKIATEFYSKNYILDRLRSI